jgi:Fe-S cluster assembly iron-binding protein IscA
MNKYDIFLICPVRNATEKQKQDIKNYLIECKEKGLKVYYPATDTKQDGDPTGYRICSDNREAIIQSKEVHRYYDKNSTGSLFDLGMTFMAVELIGKKFKLVNPQDVIKTEGKSFENMMLHWHDRY